MATGARQSAAIVLTHWGWDKMRQFADNILICILFSEQVWILIKISLMFLPKGPIDNMSALDKIMAWCRSKPLSEPILIRLLQHICHTQPQLVTCKRGMSSSSIIKNHIYLENMGFDEGWKIQIYFYAFWGKCRITCVDTLAPGDMVVISKV